MRHSRALSPSHPPFRGKPVDQRQPVETLAKTPREIIGPALGTQSAPLPDLLHADAEDQNLVHQRRAVGAELAFGPVQPQHRPALAFGDRLRRPPAIAIFPRRIAPPPPPSAL